MTDAVAKLGSLLPVCESGPPTDSPRSYQLWCRKSLTKAADKLGRLPPCHGGRALVSSQTGGRRDARVPVGRPSLGMARGYVAGIVIQIGTPRLVLTHRLQSRGWVTGVSCGSG